MKLKELVDDIFKDGPLKPYDNGFNIPNYTLYGEKELSQYKDKLLQCEEFSELNELEFMSMPFITINDKPLQAQQLIINDGVKIKGKCYLLSVTYTPEIYDPTSIHQTVKDGASITPTIYDPTTFQPLKKIVLSFSPERKQDLSNLEFDQEQLVKQELHDLLDKVLESPEEYQVKGIRKILIRGIFENIESPNIPTPQPLSGIINKQDVNPTHCMIFYLNKINNENGVTVKLENKMIPSELKDKFLEEFKEEGIHVTEEQIEEFLKRNNITK